MDKKLSAFYDRQLKTIVDGSEGDRYKHLFYDLYVVHVLLLRLF